MNALFFDASNELRLIAGEPNKLQSHDRAALNRAADEFDFIHRAYALLVAQQTETAQRLTAASERLVEVQKPVTLTFSPLSARYDGPMPGVFGYR